MWFSPCVCEIVRVCLFPATSIIDTLTNNNNQNNNKNNKTKNQNRQPSSSMSTIRLISKIRREGGRHIKTDTFSYNSTFLDIFIGVGKEVWTTSPAPNTSEKKNPKRKWKRKGKNMYYIVVPLHFMRVNHPELLSGLSSIFWYFSYSYAAAAGHQKDVTVWTEKRWEKALQLKTE